MLEGEEKAEVLRKNIDVPDIETVFSQARNGRNKRVEESLNLSKSLLYIRYDRMRCINISVYIKFYFSIFLFVNNVQDFQLIVLMSMVTLC